VRIVVTGGTGTLGRPTVAALVRAGHEVAVLSRRRDPAATRAATRAATPAAEPDAGTRVLGDLRDPQSLRDVCRGAEVVLHLATGSGRSPGRVDVEGTASLVAAARSGRVRHFAYVSIVGCDRVPSRYYRAKACAEEHVRDGGLPWTVLRATQFHPRVATLLGWSPVVPRGWVVQPMAPGVLATVLAELVGVGPSMNIAVAGPSVCRVEDLAAALNRALDRRPRPAVPVPGGASAAVSAGALTNLEAAYPGPTFAQWLAEDSRQDLR
jgi:uncharacterized protein YbjT (DUF2867 family)